MAFRIGGSRCSPHTHYPNGGGGLGGGRGFGGGGYQPLPNGSMPDIGRKNSAWAKIADNYLNGGSVGGAFDRTHFLKELAQTPGLRDKIMRIANNEQGRNPAGTQAVIESMMNRANVRHTSLAAQAKWFRLEKGGYYDPGSMGRGALENPKIRAILEKSLANALGGADTIDHATDNSSGALAARERATGRFVFHRKINGESFFSPGSAEPKLRLDYEALMAQERAEQSGTVRKLHASIRDHIRHGQGNVSSLGSAHIKVDVNAPKGTRTSAKADGVFKTVKLNRGRPMAMASQDA